MSAPTTMSRSPTRRAWPPLRRNCIATWKCCQPAIRLTRTISRALEFSSRWIMLQLAQSRPAGAGAHDDVGPSRVSPLNHGPVDVAGNDDPLLPYLDYRALRDVARRRVGRNQDVALPVAQ